MEFQRTYVLPDRSYAPTWSATPTHSPCKPQLSLHGHGCRHLALEVVRSHRPSVRADIIKPIARDGMLIA
eukprot:385825-Amorphochlora_amoeboformis.AAC.1